MLKEREGGEHERGIIPPRGGLFPREGDYSPSRKGVLWPDFSRFGLNLLLEKIFLVA